LRKRLLAEIAPLAMHCPWLSELGDPLTMSPTGLLVLEALLPEATKAVDRQITGGSCGAVRKPPTTAGRSAPSWTRRSASVRTRAAQAADPGTVRRTAERVAALLRPGRRYTAGRAAAMRNGIELRNAAIRQEPVARRMQRLTERLHGAVAVSTGWLNLRTALPLVLMLFLLPRLGARFVVR
jgi:hypothetical protein